jgi:vacuolar-type H+-ATPase subunit H
MDEREGKKRGLISSMLDLFGEEPPDSPRPAYGFTPGAEEPEAAVDEAPASEAPASEAPDETAEPTTDDGFQPVTPEQIGTIRPSYLTAVPDAPDQAEEPEVEEAAEAPAPATEPAPTGDLGPLRAALSGILTSPAAEPTPEAAAYLAQASSVAPHAHEEALDPAAAAEVAAIAAEVARSSGLTPTPVPPQPHVDPASISARVNEMLASTERLTRDLTAQAEAEAEEIVARARRQSEQHVAQAHDEATQLVAKARSEAAGIASAAERAAEDTRRTAEEEAEHIRGYARRNASMLVQAAQANRTQVQKSLEQVMDESELLSKEFVRALGDLVSDMRPVIEPVEPDVDAAGGSEPAAIA